MARYLSPEDTLINAILAKQPQVTLRATMTSFEKIVKNAFQKEPRLMAYLDSYSYTYMKKGLVQLTYDYEVSITYQDDAPDDVNTVVVDRGGWDAREVLGKAEPREVTLVTKDRPGLEQRLSAILKPLSSNYEGISGWHNSYMTFESLTDDTLCRVSYNYLAEIPVLRQLQSKALFAAKTIWRTLQGRANVPQFIKPFLAYSYLQQECIYDQRAYDELADDPERTPSDPACHLAYGPLVEKRGICSGFAWAFKRLMDEANVECICISGYMTHAPTVGHLWNMVKLDGQYYHVDPTSSSKDNAVYINTLLKPDSAMRKTHIWDETLYPAAKGMRFGYDFIEDFLVDHGDDYLDQGAAEQYMFPEEIVE